MEPQRDERDWYRRLKEAFVTLSRLPERERAEELVSMCGDDTALRADLEALLRADAKTGFLDPQDPEALSIADAAWAAGTGALTSAEETPERIGPFRVEGLIAHGGMAAVYRAAQEHPKRTVAIKLIRPGPGSGGLLARLDREANLLARLQHPNIAQVFDAGRFDSGLGRLPYLVMEFVEGAPIDEGARGLGIEERVRLLIEVARAVEHAHQRGVIHRDLKPANVLLTREGRVKVLDFGVARLLDEEHGSATAHTRPGQLIGTVRYMSPEQAGGRPDEVDTRTDVYGLGVLAYELLGGRAAFDVDALTVLEAIRIVLERAPARLGEVEPRTRGDLETIVAKAMEKDKERRYASASELASDLERFLADEPVLARRASAAYRARKFAQRHRGPVLGAAVALLALVGGTAFASWQAVERSREAAQLRAVNKFWNDLLGSPDPNASGLGGEGEVDVTVASFLEEASRRLGGAYAERPAVEAELRATIGRTFVALERHEEALPELERAHGLSVRLFGKNDTRTLLRRMLLAHPLMATGRREEAESLLLGVEEALLRRVGGGADTDEASVRCAVSLASLYQDAGEIQSTEKWSEEAVRRVRAAGLERSEAGITALMFRAFVQMRQSRLEPAAELYREALANCDATVDPGGTQRIAVMSRLAELEWRMGDPARSEALLREAIAASKEKYGPMHSGTLDLEASLAQLVHYGGEPEAGIRMLERVLRDFIASGHEDDALATRASLGRLLYNAGEYERGAEVNREAFEAFEVAQGADGIQTMVTLNHLAACLRDGGRMEEAGVCYRSLRERVDRAFGDAIDGRAVALRKSIGTYYLRAGEYEEAESLLLWVFEASRAEAMQRQLSALLVELYEAWGRPDEAARWKAAASGP